MNLEIRTLQFRTLRCRFGGENFYPDDYFGYNFLPDRIEWFRLKFSCQKSWGYFDLSRYSPSRGLSKAEFVDIVWPMEIENIQGHPFQWLKWTRILSFQSNEWCGNFCFWNLKVTFLYSLVARTDWSVVKLQIVPIVDHFSYDLSLLSLWSLVSPHLPWSIVDSLYIQIETIDERVYLFIRHEKRILRIQFILVSCTRSTIFLWVWNEEDSGGRSYRVHTLRTRRRSVLFQFGNFM